MAKADEHVSIHLRLPLREHEEIKNAAEDACRSVQREILFRLRQSRRDSVGLKASLREARR